MLALWSVKKFLMHSERGGVSDFAHSEWRTTKRLISHRRTYFQSTLVGGAAVLEGQDPKAKFPFSEYTRRQLFIRGCDTCLL